MSRRASPLVFLVFVLGLVGCDHATKWLAVNELRGQPPRSLISGVLDLRYTENRDVGFSLLRAVPEGVRKPLIFAGVGAGLLVLGALWWQRRSARWPEHVAYSLLLAGGLGNLSDRLLRGYVVDFVYLHYWPVFNMADVFLVVGAGLVLLLSRRAPAPRPA
jgi:signal peptidase II